ncbi:MAG: hydrogenase maturation protease, partial [Actinomycetota bacterium]
GAAPGTIYRIPGEELEDLPALDGLHTHQFRWDHALSFGRWLLGDEYPTDITVFLIEAESVEPGAPLTSRVERSMHEVETLVRDLLPADGAQGAEAVETWSVEITADGSLRIAADLATAHFASDALVADIRDGELWLLPLVGPHAGGLLLKQRNAAGDRATLIWEVLPPGMTPTGPRSAFWDEQNGALRVGLTA